MIFFTKKSDFAVFPGYSPGRGGPACIFAMSPSLALCRHTGDSQGSFLPQDLCTSCALCWPSACLSPSELSWHWFTFWVSAQMSLC